MRHLTSSPSSSPHYISLSFTSLYAFLSSSPTTCIPHVASDVDLNSSVEPPCLLCRHSRTFLPKTQKWGLKNRNVDLNGRNVDPYVGLDPGMERLCILCRHYRTIFPKKKKSQLKNRNVDLANMNVASNVDLNSSVERACILCRQYRAILPKPQKISLGTSNVDLANMNVASDVGLDPAMERSCMLCRQYWTVLPKPRKAPSKMWNVGPDSKNIVSYVSGNHVSTLPIFIAFFPRRGRARGSSRAVSPVITLARQKDSQVWQSIGVRLSLHEVNPIFTAEIPFG
jgi:hypothetical protein